MVSAAMVYVQLQCDCTDLSFQAFPSSTIFYLTLLTTTFTLPGQGHEYFYTSWTGSIVLLHFLDRIHCTFTLSYLTQHSDHTYFTISKRVKERDAQCASHNQNLVTRYAQIATR